MEHNLSFFFKNVFKAAFIKMATEGQMSTRHCHKASRCTFGLEFQVLLKTGSEQRFLAFEYVRTVLCVCLLHVHPCI